MFSFQPTWIGCQNDSVQNYSSIPSTQSERVHITHTHTNNYTDNRWERWEAKKRRRNLMFGLAGSSQFLGSSGSCGGGVGIPSIPSIPSESWAWQQRMIDSFISFASGSIRPERVRPNQGRQVAGGQLLISIAFCCGVASVSASRHRLVRSSCFDGHSRLRLL